MEMNESKAQRSLGIALAILAIILFFCIIPWQIQFVADADPSPRFFPRAITVLLFLCSVGLFLNGMLTRNAPDQKRYTLTKAGGKLVVLTLAALAVYTVLLHYIPYIPATIATLAFLIWRYGQKRPLRLIGVSVIVPVAIYLSFTKLLLLRLP